MGKDYSIIFKEIQRTKPRVKILLESIPVCRESDDKLLAYFWYYELKALDKIYSLKETLNFIGFLSNGNLTSPESIRRSRQWLFEHHPELRGDNYIDRKKAGFETKEQFKNQQ